ncbi:MAG: tetratricopeptide repeat protein [Candidatus Schekmanbacteria bacterium]|nr:tetratricopeptide repeat protein [Candidatus Schekmanbacteria bacterium]
MKKLIVIAIFAAILLGGRPLKINRAWAKSAAEEEAGVWKQYNEALKGEDLQPFRQVIQQAGVVMREYPSKVNVADMLFLLGLCYENSYEFTKALTYYKELLNVYPYHKNAKAVRYKLTLIEDTYKTEKQSLIMFIQQERLMLQGKYKEAVERCRKLLSTYPSASLADNTQNVIGYLYVTYLKDYVYGRKEYEKLLMLYPTSEFHDNAVFAIGRCYEEMGFYESALRYYRKLIQKHQGLLFSKTDYWSRVWYTRADEQIGNVKMKMESLQDKLNPLDSMVYAEYDYCVNNKRGPGGLSAKELKSWIKPAQTDQIIAELGLSPSNVPETALKIWNYVAEKFPYTRNYGNDDFWQYPEETIQRKSGDGADLSFLMASLLLASGVDRGKVWLVIGTDKDNNQHVWVNLKHDGEWYFLEPSWEAPFEDLPLTKYEGGYTPCYAFNDTGLKINPRIKPFFSDCK